MTKIAHKNDSKALSYNHIYISLPREHEVLKSANIHIIINN